MISENGWGETIPRNTERFYRGTHGGKTKRTGLGFSLCNEMVMMQGVTMEIRTKEGEGTRIFLDISSREVQ